MAGKYYAENYLLKKKAANSGVEDLSGPIPGSAYDEMPMGEYEKAIKARNAKENPAAQAAPTASEGVSAGLGSPAASQAAQDAGNGNALGTVGNGLMAAGAIPSPASPYLLAGGLAVNVLAAGEQNKRAAEEKQRQEYNDRIARRQQMMNQIAQMRIE